MFAWVLVTRTDALTLNDWCIGSNWCNDLECRLTCSLTHHMMSEIHDMMSTTSVWMHWHQVRVTTSCRRLGLMHWLKLMQWFRLRLMHWLKLMQWFTQTDAVTQTVAMIQTDALTRTDALPQTDAVTQTEAEFEFIFCWRGCQIPASLSLIRAGWRQEGHPVTNKSFQDSQGCRQSAARSW